MNDLIINNKSEEWSAALLLFLFIPPYFMWELLSSNIFRIILTLILCLIFYKNRGIKRKIDSRLTFFFILTLIYFILLGIFHDQSNINGVLAKFSIIFYIYLPFAKAEFTKQVYKKFLTIYSIVILISIISFSGYQLGVLHSIGQIQLAKNQREYILYPLLVIEKGYDFFRFYGPFNEPGVVGTLGAVLLCIEKFNFKDWRVISILISGILSMSLFFFILVISFGFIYLFLIKKNIFFSILFIISFSLFYIKTKDNPLIYQTLWQRFEWDEANYKLKGDNRRNENVEYIYSKLKETPEFWFGSPQKDIENFWRQVEETSSYKVVVLYNGIIFLIAYLLFYILLAYSHRSSKKLFALFVIILIANTYQRPDIYNIVVFFIYTYFACHGISRNNISKSDHRKLISV